MIEFTLMLILFYFLGMLVFAIICDLGLDLWDDTPIHLVVIYSVFWFIYIVVVPLWRAIKYIANRFYYTNW